MLSLYYQFCVSQHQLSIKGCNIMASPSSTSSLTESSKMLWSPSHSRPSPIYGPLQSREAFMDTSSLLPNPSNLGHSSYTKRNHIDRQSIEDVERPLQAPNTSRRRKRMRQKMLHYLSPDRGEFRNQYSPAVQGSNNQLHAKIPAVAQSLQPSPTNTTQEPNPSESIRLAPPPGKADEQPQGKTLDARSPGDVSGPQAHKGGNGRLPGVQAILSGNTYQDRPSSGGF